MSVLDPYIQIIGLKLGIFFSLMSFKEKNPQLF